ncbi:MAG TPA: heme A synthase, partial [Anaerolineae bacterium]|nr:heme A synthase [Anaerolineae bacterium]
MSENDNKLLTKWLILTCGIIMILVVFGGYVRLTRAGLSIVEWNPISGVLPPIGESAWQAEFAKYQQSPEFQKVNQTMTLDGYKQIFY